MENYIEELAQKLAGDILANFIVKEPESSSVGQYTIEETAEHEKAAAIKSVLDMLNNTRDADLSRIEHVGPDRAQIIIARRNQGLKFMTIEEVMEEFDMNEPQVMRMVEGIVLSCLEED